MNWKEAAPGWSSAGAAGSELSAAAAASSERYRSASVGSADGGRLARRLMPGVLNENMVGFTPENEKRA